GPFVFTNLHGQGSPRGEAFFASRFKPIGHSRDARKNNYLSSFRNSCFRPPVPRRQKGRIAIVTNVARNAVDADALTDERRDRGRRSRVVLAPQGPAPSWRRCLRIAPMTVANGMVHRGDHV